VNNFSEVNVELGNELKQEVKKLALTDEQSQNLHSLADELLMNQEKIAHHGKRAGAIVRNMLQHTRKSSGVRELTNINVLVNESLKLSYNGFRNKHKTFASKIETDFDEAVSQVNVMPQDLSHALVNLLNNAFYAVNEKKKQLNGTFEPTVLVSTKKAGNKVIISVNDNGTGMSEKVTAKVFQPFFTTKPNGEGTGLGLSLSYDVVTKGHGGEIRVESKEGEGANFTIQLPA
jgi:signal transduction histidine kinase